MKKEHADEWIKALRSGKYKQGKGYLYNAAYNKWCCLGVLNDLHGGRLGNGTIGTLRLDNGIIKSDTGFICSLNARLVDLNDKGYTDTDGFTKDSLNFDEIADIIQMCWEEL
jgi:hypothetical protein